MKYGTAFHESEIILAATVRDLEEIKAHAALMSREERYRFLLALRALGGFFQEAHLSSVDTAYERERDKKFWIPKN